MQRRDFLKTSCGVCALFTPGLLAGMLESCGSLPVYEADREGAALVVPLARFDINETQIVRGPGEKYDIAVRRLDQGMYLALLMACTHAANQLVDTGSEFVCRLHGSRYNGYGEVIQGPAERPLKILGTKVEEDRLLVLLP